MTQQRKGIILAGGSGSRLYPMTQPVSKQFMPVYDKPMIYYPLCTLMLGGIRDILIISTPRDTPLFEAFLGDGSKWGLNLSYAVQEKPSGLPEAYIIGKDFLGNSPSTLILGDNVFYGNYLGGKMAEASAVTDGAVVFAYRVSDPERYGVVTFDEGGKVTSIEEKPTQPKSNYAITGLYFFDHQASAIAKELKPSTRGETEITDMIRAYLHQNKLSVQLMGRGIAWLDTGTPDALLQASQFIGVIEKRQGFKICCPEEIAHFQGFIDKAQLAKLAAETPKSDYKNYLLSLLE